MGKKQEPKRNTHGSISDFELIGNTDPVTGKIAPLTDDDLLRLVRRDPKTGEPVPGALAELKRQRAAYWGKPS